MKNDSKKLKKLKSSVTSRVLSLSKMTLKAGVEVTAYGLSNVFADKSEKIENWKNLLVNQADLLTQELSQLKGSLMKAGQQLSVYGEHFFPPEVNEIFKKLQSQSTPLDWEPIKKTIEENLTPEQLSELEIDSEPISSASLGQVHKAKIKSTGEWIAIKVQYPGVEGAIDSDLRALRTFLSVLKILPAGPQTDQLFEEIKQMLIQETNFLQEADRTEEFYNKLSQDNRYVVPKVYREYSNKKILATSFEHSLRVDSFEIQNLSQEHRNTLAESFLDLYFKELFEWGLVQTDPHLGNYGVRLEKNASDSKLVLYDFGAVRNYDSVFLNTYYKMIYSALTDNKPEVFNNAYKLRFLFEDDDPSLKEIFYSFCKDMLEPFNGVYDWKNSNLPQRMTKKLLELKRNYSVRTPPREVVFLDRKTAGVFIFLAVLKAKIEAHPQLMRYLKTALDRPH